MKAEYIPPKEDVILQNEAPTDLYILVTGAVVRAKNPKVHSHTETLFHLHLRNYIIFPLFVFF